MDSEPQTLEQRFNAPIEICELLKNFTESELTIIENFFKQKEEFHKTDPRKRKIYDHIDSGELDQAQVLLNEYQTSDYYDEYEAIRMQTFIDIL